LTTKIRRIYGWPAIYTGRVSKHLVDIDDEALQAARAELRTGTIKETVNEALRQAGAARYPRVKRALDFLAGADLDEREEAWR
jgi:Arc/MetJ family transcription regulator